MNFDPMWPFFALSLIMEHLNQIIFLLLNAGDHPAQWLVSLARFLAEDLIWLVPAGFTLGWLRGSVSFRYALVSAALSGLAGLMANQLIGLLWYHPRPLAVGIGHTLIPHTPDSSFPSDHLTLIWSVGASLLSHARTRRIGWLTVLAGLPVAWARIYLGVHFPLDMAGAALVGLASAWMIERSRDAVTGPVVHGLLRIHPILFAGLIRRGWVRQ